MPNLPMPPLAIPVEITPLDATISDSGPVELLLSGAQLAKLAELLNRHVDLDVVRLDNDDPEGATFVTGLVKTIRGALDEYR
jgi:hypothetical protein